MCFCLHFGYDFCIEEWWWWWWWRNCITCLVVGFFFFVLFGCFGILKDWETDEICLQFSHWQNSTAISRCNRIDCVIIFVLGLILQDVMYIADGLILFLSRSSRCSLNPDWFVSFCFGFGFDLWEVLIGFVLIQKMMMMRRRRSCCWS